MSKVLIFILFYNDLRPRVASSAARNFSKDNLLHHNLSESKYLSPYLTDSLNSNFFSFLHLSKSDAKKRSFFIFLKRPSFHCQKFISEIIHFLNLAQNANKTSFALNFNNNFKGPSFFGHWIKNLETSTRNF